MNFGTSPLELMACDAMMKGTAYLQEFTYSAAFVGATVLGANATVDVQIQINADSDFVVQECNLTTWSAAGTIIADPDYLITLILAGSGRQLMNQAQPVLNYCGSYRQNCQPGFLPMPLLIQAQSTITVTLVNRTATASVRADVSLQGFKVFYTGSDADGANRRTIFHVL